MPGQVAGVGQRAIHSRHGASDRATGVCCAITSETKTPTVSTAVAPWKRSGVRAAYQLRMRWWRTELGSTKAQT